MLRALRLLAVLCSLASALVPGVVSVLDAAEETRSYSVASHVEQEGGTGCPEVHDAHCALCTTLRSGRAAPAPPARVAIPRRVTAVAPIVRRMAPPLAAAIAAAPPRAPPTTV